MALFVTCQRSTQQGQITEVVDNSISNDQPRWLTAIGNNHDANPERWAGLRSIGMAENETHKGDKRTIERRYFITTLGANAQQFAHAVRNHWGIENRLHWVLDMSFREDECRVRRGDGAEILGVVRHIALNLLRQDKTSKRGIKGKRYNAALDINYAAKVLAPVLQAHQRLQEVAAHRAARAAVVERHDLLGHVHILFDEAGIDVHGAELVLDDADLDALLVGQDVVDQRRLAAAEEPGDDRDRPARARREERGREEVS